MKKTGLLSFGLLCLLLSTVGYSQIHYRASLSSSIYALETPEAVQRGDYYQGVQLRLYPFSNRQIYFNTYFRLAKLGSSAWEEKFYNSYIHWNSQDKRWRVRVGRQFLFQGVVNGTMDGVTFTGNISPKLKFTVVGGVEAPYQREFRVVNTDSAFWGGVLNFKPTRNHRIQFSYINRTRNNESIWNLLGLTFTGRYRSNWIYLFQLEHNLQSGKLQGVRSRVTYNQDKWSLSGEINSQKPRVFEDSFFRIFVLNPFVQLRTAATYEFNTIQLGVQYLFTKYEEDQTNQIIATVGKRWGVIGVIYQNGFAGDNIGLYGDVRYPLRPWLSIKLKSSYYNYQRHAVLVGEEATAFSAGVILRPYPSLSVHAEVQQGINSFYKNDFRGLFRVQYLIQKQ
ncbi:MAG: hypothetical protein D6748_00135 [Calditrichaeota bacterium]|nr:MAG: hypothetical protein D6748_00135 [Calditrichota bacterium]